MVLGRCIDAVYTTRVLLGDGKDRPHKTPFSWMGGRLSWPWLGRCCINCKYGPYRKGEMFPVLVLRAPRLIKRSRNTIDFSRWERLLGEKAA